MSKLLLRASLSRALKCYKKGAKRISLSKVFKYKVLAVCIYYKGGFIRIKKGTKPTSFYVNDSKIVFKNHSSFLK